jgi:hypothetical protein
MRLLAAPPRRDPVFRDEKENGFLFLFVEASTVNEISLSSLLFWLLACGKLRSAIKY